MSTPYTEGRLAGYLGTPRNRNPYVKGVCFEPEGYEAALDWIRGHIEGQSQARDDLIAKHREGTR